MEPDLSPVLINSKVILRPLHPEDEIALQPIAASEPDTWEFGTTDLSVPDNLKAYLHSAIAQRNAGIAAVWTIIDPVTHHISGCTRLGEIDFKNGHGQIGWTWISKQVRATGLNKAMKYEILKYGFEQLGLHRIQLKADERNLRSQQAILSIGAQFEGIIREHIKNHDGFMRSSAYYSILKHEWPEVKAMLEAKLGF